MHVVILKIKRKGLIMSIKENRGRFRDIVRGKVRDNLKKYISQSNMTGKRENDMVTIPVHSIDIPNFRFGKGDSDKGVGQGKESQDGDPQNGQPGQGQKAGSESSEHAFETEFTVNELAEILGEHLQLPELKPKGNNKIATDSKRYSSLAQVGPDGLRQFKNTYKKALKKSIASGKYNKVNPQIIPTRQDYVFKAPKTISKPNAKAVVFYIMDISGSMGNEQKIIVKNTTFWLNAWIQKHYKGLESRFIVHEAKAWETTEEEFYKIAESGGTLISSSYDAVLKIINEEYNPNDWNIYIFQFSDGDNWSGEDSNKCVNLLNYEILKIANLFAYGQVESKYGSGEFLKVLERNFKQDVSNLKTSTIRGMEGILDAIKNLLGS
jgi:uncharacterized protein